MTLSRVALLVLTTLSFYACGGNERTEDTGVIPKLNRDSDVAGPDADRNGVRDDLDAYINSTSDTVTQQNALRQGFTQITNAMTVDLNNEELLQEVMDGISAAVHCIYGRYDIPEARIRIKEIQTYAVNTEERIKAYANYHHAISGRGTFLPKGDSCNE